MTLQRRLTLFFVLIVMFPLLAAWLIVQSVIASEISRRAVLSLRPTLDASIALYNNQNDVMQRRIGETIDGARLAQLLDKGTQAQVDAYLRARIGDTTSIDFLAAVGPNGDVLGFASKPGFFVEDFVPPTEAELVAAGPGAQAGFVRGPDIPLRSVSGRSFGHLAGGFWLDEELLIAASRSDVDLSLVSNDRVIASTAPLEGPALLDVRFHDDFETELGDQSMKAEAVEIGPNIGVVATTPSRSAGASGRILGLMLAVFIAALAATSLLAYLLARWITQPLEDLAEGAEAVAEGRFDHQIAVRSKDEVGQLATAFNFMTARLQDTIGQLSSSRDQLQRAVRRVGETLRSTHDMNQMLESILNSAADAVNADLAVLWSFTPTRDELYATATRGIDPDSLARVKVGEGVVGVVAERSNPVVVPGEGGGPPVARGEPSAPVAIAVPLHSQDTLRYVLALYRESKDRPFSTEDVDMVLFLAQQGGVAIENVLLHEEAQRLSITDGLTGVWNRRYFQMQFRQILATAQRFKRPFSLLMLDLDHFKEVNDLYGHQRGDEILVEFSQRVTRMLREVDTIARYGGEEFIVLLSETDVTGAVITAQKILESIRQKPFGGFDETQVEITVSIGVASYPDHGDSLRNLIETADQALYQAKKAGRDRVAVARSSAELRLAK